MGLHFLCTKTKSYPKNELKTCRNTNSFPMKFYRSNFRKFLLIGVIVFFLSSGTLYFVFPKWFDANILLLSLFLYLLATHKIKDDDNKIKSIQYETFYLTFIVFFASFLSFSFVYILDPTISITPREILYVITLFLLMHNILFHLKLQFQKQAKAIANKRAIRLSFTIASLILLIFVLCRILADHAILF